MRALSMFCVRNTRIDMTVSCTNVVYSIRMGDSWAEILDTTGPYMYYCSLSIPVCLCVLSPTYVRVYLSQRLRSCRV